MERKPTTDDLMKLALNYGNSAPQTPGVDLIIICFHRETGLIGWGSTVSTPDMLSIVADVLDNIICAGGGS